MSGRRSHPRFAVTNPWDGAIRILRDVVVNRIGVDELLAVSNAPAIVGEMLSLELMGAGQRATMKVQVLDSRPVIIEGSVRHRVELKLVDVQPDTLLVETALAEAAAAGRTIQRAAEAG
jgi:hypothetical protein